jgi:hypothetical protein
MTPSGAANTADSSPLAQVVGPIALGPYKRLSNDELTRRIQAIREEAWARNC